MRTLATVTVVGMRLICRHNFRHNRPLCMWTILRAQCPHNRRLAGRMYMRRRAQRAPFMHAAETCCTQCTVRSSARSRMAEGSNVAGSLHAANDNPAGDDGGSNEAGNSEVVSLMDI